ncbi:hypothetical protein AMJ57_00770 [Parcubacteria bacterium SG8_24]|nr:MAG: hypothetical protein AMJ57_00770 [Parcubacteria bacterium SG8_24]
MTPVTTQDRTATDIGTLLRTRREEFGLSREKVAQQTGLPLKYLVTLEEQDLHRLPNDVYTRIYLKTYARFLGVDDAVVAGTLARLRQVHHPEESGDFGPESRRKHPRTSVPTKHLLVTPKLIQRALILFAVCGLGVYLVSAVKDIVAPPEISLYNPRDGYVTADNSVMVEGKTEREVVLHINGKMVPTDEGGNFTDTLELQTGLNVIKVVGTKKHSKEMVITRRVIVRPSDRPTASLKDVREGGL